jgi:hypothetical protein
MALGTRLKVGKVSVRTPKYMSEAGYVKSVNQGMNELRKNLDYIIQQFEDVTPEFMMEALRPTFEKTQTRVPVRGGRLKRSGYLEVVQNSRGNPVVEMGYAKGGVPDYAVYVHEMTEIKHAAPTTAKFVEGPVNEDLGDIIDRLAARYKDFVGAV